MKIALAQISSSTDPESNLELIRTQSYAAATQGAELVVFPEASMCAFGVDLQPIAEPITGAWASAVRALAAELNITIIVGMFTPGAEGRVRNTLLVAGPSLDTHYDKIHLYDAYGYRESDAVTPGEHPVTFELNGITFGLATCYDVRFPELFFATTAAGASVNIVCASWAMGDGKVEQWQLSTRARAMDSTTFVVAVDQADPHTAHSDIPRGVPLGVGHSAVISPLGVIMEDLGPAPELRLVELDISLVKSAREGLPVLANARLR